MSWCGGGEIRPTPGVEWRTAAICAVDLVAGQLAALARLGALGDLDLEIVGIDQIFGGDAEPARGDLLDRRALESPLAQRLEAVALLAALAGVRLAADPVHRHRQRGVRLAADRAEAHRAGREALDDRRRPARPRRAAPAGRPASELDQAAHGEQPPVLRVELVGEGAIFVGQIAAHRMLEIGDAVERPGMVLAADPLGVERRRDRARRRPADRRSDGGARSPRRSRRGRRPRSRSRCR